MLGELWPLSSPQQPPGAGQEVKVGLSCLPAGVALVVLEGGTWGALERRPGHP